MPEFTEIFGGREITTVIIGTSKTVGYRKLASTQVCAGDSVVEIGCDLGITTKLLRQRCTDVIGIDRAADRVAIAISNCQSDVTFIVMNVLEDVERLCEICKR